MQPGWRIDQFHGFLRRFAPAFRPNRRAGRHGAVAPAGNRAQGRQVCLGIDVLDQERLHDRTACFDPHTSLPMWR